MSTPLGYRSISETVTMQPQPQDATFLPFQQPEQQEPKKPCKCCVPCCIFAQMCACLAEVCFAVCDCRIPMRETILMMAWAMIGTAFFVFFALKMGLTAGYGRYTNQAQWGINPKLAWFIQESPAFFIPFYFLFGGLSSTGRILNCIFLVHYFYRALIYPFRIRSTTKSPLLIVAAAVAFCTYNGTLQGVWNSYYQLEEELTYRHLIGSILYFSGMFINHKSDNILMTLRKPGETGYKIPTGFLYEYISCPNYFGEIMEWIGYAILGWNLPALAFAIFTFANIGPRAIAHHNWYKEKFPKYPPTRRALIPYIY